MKKKLFVVLMLAVMLLPVIALAEGELPTDPFTWAQLVTILGATAATTIFVQLLKLPLDRVWKIPTRIVVYFIALVIMLLATLFTEGLTLNNALLTAINAGIVALAAMGSYEVFVRKLEGK